MVGQADPNRSIRARRPDAPFSGTVRLRLLAQKPRGIVFDEGDAAPDSDAEAASDQPHISTSASVF